MPFSIEHAPARFASRMNFAPQVDDDGAADLSEGFLPEPQVLLEEAIGAMARVARQNAASRRHPSS